MQKTSIPWTSYSWNPTSGCSGPNGVRCSYCYAFAASRRFGRSFEPTFHPEKLAEPLKLKKPSRIFVDSNGDLFDPAITDEQIARVWTVMSRAPQHMYQILTKRPGWMRDIVSRIRWHLEDSVQWAVLDEGDEYTLPNVHLGVTVEHQAAADERIPLLLQTPAAVHWISAEPLLGPINLMRWLGGNHETGGAGISSAADNRGLLRWCVIGNDSTRGAKLPDPAWVQSLIDQCRAAGVPIWIKGALHDQFPITEWPK